MTATTTKTPAVRVARKAPSGEATAPADNSMAAVVPDKDVATRYVHRKIGEHADFAIFDYARTHRINILTEGPTGCGKTMCARAYAAENGLRFFAMSSNVGVDPSQLFGRMIPTDDGHYAWQDGPVTDLLRYGGVLVVDEINFLPERVSTVLFPVLDERRSTNLVDHKNELIVAHPDLLIVAGMNPGYAGTRSLNAALRNRFAIQMDWDYDIDQESKLVKSNALMTIATQLRSTDEIRTPVSTNMLMELEKFASSVLGPDFAIMNFIAHFDRDHEQSNVQAVLDAQRDALVRELSGGIEDDEDDWDESDYDLTVNGTVDNPNPINHPDWQPHMGVYKGNPDTFPADYEGETWNLFEDEDANYETAEA